LVKAAHPGPSIVVTSVGTALAASAGQTPVGCLLVAAALLTGQLSIGWCNDYVDRERDRASARIDKPIAVGTVSSTSIGSACLVALVLCVPLSFAVGWQFGVVHLVAVGGGWAYDLGLKGRLGSFVPYAVSFGLLPSLATLSLDPAVWAPWWGTAAGACLGVAAHLANALPDLADDRATGVHGLPQRLGATASRVVAAGCLAAGALLLAFAPPGPPGVAGLVGLAATALLLVAAFGVSWPTASRAPFALTVAAALAVVAMLIARGTVLA